MTDNLPEIVVEDAVELGVVRATNPAQLVAQATEAANALAAVIESRKLFSNIQGKRYVRCEGWTTLAAMLGVLPRELSVVEHPEGTFTATVELVRMTDQAVLTRASAECGMDESTWKSRPRYARRSMALTRATAKACRIAFSWVMVLAGYEVTPAEEMPERSPEVRAVQKPQERVPVPHSVAIAPKVGLDTPVIFGPQLKAKRTVAEAGRPYFEALIAKYAGDRNAERAEWFQFCKDAVTAFEAHDLKLDSQRLDELPTALTQPDAEERALDAHLAAAESFSGKAGPRTREGSAK